MMKDVMLSDWFPPIPERRLALHTHIPKKRKHILRDKVTNKSTKLWLLGLKCYLQGAAEIL